MAKNFDKLSDDLQEVLNNDKQTSGVISGKNILLNSLNSNSTMQSSDGGVVPNLTNAGSQTMKIEKPQNIRSAVSKKKQICCPIQNKKNFLNLCFHEEDFKLKGEWHFSATANGKGPCDGIGGSVKRLAARASLQRPHDNQIQTAQQLFECSVENITKVDFAYSTQEEYAESELFLKNHFDQVLTIQGIQHYHAFIPKTISTLLVKYFSDYMQGWENKVSKSPDKLKIGDISGYITTVYEGNWWLSYVLQKNEELEVNLTFFHPFGASASFSYPRNTDPVTPTVRSYVLLESDVCKTDMAFSNFK